METVDKLFSMVTDDRDPLLLVLGSLAEYTSEPVSVVSPMFCCLIFNCVLLLLLLLYVLVYDFC